MKRAPKYIDIRTDYGFKKLFSSPENKPVLLLFLNRVMEYIGESTIIDLEYLATEHVGLDEDSKTTRQDFECITQDGRNIIVEMQRVLETDFKERICFYSFRKSIEQVNAGQPYKIQPVYTLVIAEEAVRKKHPNFLQMANFRYINSDETFIKYPIMIILELSKLPNPQEASKLRFWHEAFNELGTWKRAPKNPEILKEIEPLLKAAEFANLSRMEQLEYYKELDRKRGIKYALEHKLNEGIEQGRAEGKLEGRAEGYEIGILKGKIELIDSMLLNGMDWQAITQITKISQEEFTKLKDSN